MFDPPTDTNTEAYTRGHDLLTWVVTDMPDVSELTIITAADLLQYRHTTEHFGRTARYLCDHLGVLALVRAADSPWSGQLQVGYFSRLIVNLREHRRCFASYAIYETILRYSAIVHACNEYWKPS